MDHKYDVDSLAALQATLAWNRINRRVKRWAPPVLVLALVIGTACIAALHQTASKPPVIVQQSTQAVQRPGAERDIVALELAEYRAWNSHNMQGVLATYWNSPDLVSIAGDDEVHGFDALQKALLSTYANPNTMGHIDLDRLKVQVLADDSACCVATYVVRTQKHVYYCDDTATLRQFRGEGWKIVFERASLVTH
jgi:hypothetical protein